jgi:hypothetical protein
MLGGLQTVLDAHHKVALHRKELPWPKGLGESDMGASLG